MCTSHLKKKTEFQTLIQDNLLLCFLAEMILAGWPDDINDVPHVLCPYHGHRNTSQLKMASSFKVKLSSFLHQKGRRPSKQYMKDTWESASAKTEPDTVCIGLVSTQTSNASLNHTQHANVTTHRNHNSHCCQC